MNQDYGEKMRWAVNTLNQVRRIIENNIEYDSHPLAGARASLHAINLALYKINGGAPKLANPEVADCIDIRASLHTLEGMLRKNRLIDLYELLQAMQKYATILARFTLA